MIDSLKNGKTIDNVPPMLNSLFRPTVQPYIISWFKYDPQNEIKKLAIPSLILQGTNDIQVSVEDAKRLSNANQKTELVLINDMLFRKSGISNKGTQAPLLKFHDFRNYSHR